MVSGSIISLGQMIDEIGYGIARGRKIRGRELWLLRHKI